MSIKKLTKFAMIALLMPVVFASCKKDFTCTCKYTDALGNEATEKYSLDNQTRADAVENCENFERSNALQQYNCNL